MTPCSLVEIYRRLEGSYCLQPSVVMVIWWYGDRSDCYDEGDTKRWRRNLLKVTVFCDLADWIDDSCIIGVDQSSIRPEDRSNRFLRTSVNRHQNQGLTFQKMAVVTVVAVITSNYFYNVNVQCKLLSQKKKQLSCFPVSTACFKINNLAFL